MDGADRHSDSPAVQGAAELGDSSSAVGTPRHRGSMILVGCRTARGTLGAVTDAPIRDEVQVLNTADGWYPAIDPTGAIRGAPRVAEPTEMVDLSKWPTGTRLTL